VEHVTGKRCFTTQRRCGKTWRPTRVPQVPLSPFSWMTEERASPPLGQGEKPFDKRAYRFPGGHAKMRRLRHPHCFDRWAGLDGAAFRMPCTCLIGVGRKFAENDVIYAETYRSHSKLFILHENAGFSQDVETELISYHKRIHNIWDGMIAIYFYQMLYLGKYHSVDFYLSSYRIDKYFTLNFLDASSNKKVNSSRGTCNFSWRIILTC
jgi:hypothetical protein